MTPGNRAEHETAAGSTPSALPRVGIAAVATLVPSLLLVHGIAALIHVAPGISPAAVAVSCTVIVVGLVHALVQWRRPKVPVWGWIITPLAAAFLLAVITRSVSGALSVATCCTMQGWAQSRVSLALPPSIDSQIGRRPWRSVAWSLLALLAVVQTARLSSHEADQGVAWWVTTDNPAWAAHLCTPAYVYAADLHRQGETNIYEESHYPPSDDPNKGSHPTVKNLSGHIECAFQYPPPFLLLPWAALQLTNDFYVVRPVWHALQGLAFLAVAVALCLWIGGPRGRRALWLLPVVWVAVPTLQTFQFGQFHLSAFALAAAGMLAFESRRVGLGGALLGAAVVTKVYPAVLLLLIASQRRWQDLGMTLIWMAAFGILGLVILGPDPYQAFLSYQVPRILDGSAFPTPSDGDEMTAIMTGVSSLPERMRILGLPILPLQIGPWLGRALGLGILAIIWRAGRRTSTRSRLVMLWFGLLNLVVLQGGAAFCDYTPATSLWLMTFVTMGMARNRLIAVVLWVSWLHLTTLLGTFPLPGYPSNAQFAASTILMTLLILTLNLWCATRTGPPEHAST